MAGKTSDSKNLCMTAQHASLQASSPVAYAGDVTPKEAYESLTAQPAVLVDVRTPQEWSQGQPDLSATPSRMVSVSLKTLPDYALNPNFAAQLAGCEGIDRQTRLFFMCKGGGRSREAATMMTALGYENCFNIAGGFEGKGDMQGWKAVNPVNRLGGYTESKV